MARFPSIDDVRTNLDLLIGRRPALVSGLDRGPGQREDRFAHLLSGEVQAVALAASAPARPPDFLSELEARVQTLEAQVALLQARLGD